MFGWKKKGNHIEQDGEGVRYPKRGILALPGKLSAFSRLILALFNFGFTAVVMVILALSAAIYFGAHAYLAPGPLMQERIINIPPGANVSSIARMLHEKDIISNPVIFRLAARILKNQQKLMAGEYAFLPRISMRDAMDKMLSGDIVIYRLTFPEGFTSEQIIARINNSPLLSGEVAVFPAEGTLSPNTYQLFRGQNRQDLVIRMQQAQQQIVKRIWQARAPDLPYKTVEEMVTLASIIEKETSRIAEKSIIAGVFANRLKRGMRLQSDPTILYGLYGGSAFSKRRGGITRKELRAKDNIYNTYQINGLPPGPIGNPGVKALEAAANPARVSALYFVADGKGGHVFADTYEDHKKNVKKWRAMQN